MPNGVWELDLCLLFPLSFENVEVCSADTGCTNLDYDVEGGGDFWFGGCVHLEVLVVPDDADDLHVAHIVCVYLLSLCKYSAGAKSAYPRHKIEVQKEALAIVIAVSCICHGDNTG